MSSSFQTNRILEQIGANIVNKLCDVETALLGGTPTPTPIEDTFGGNTINQITDGAGASTPLVLSAIPSTNNIRKVSIVTDQITQFSITILLHDASTWTHTVWGTGYDVELELNQSPISSITVTELAGISNVSASINTLSK